MGCDQSAAYSVQRRLTDLKEELGHEQLIDREMALPEVQIELYENGKGPRHTFKAKLQGWEANRLDLETIQNTYRLEAVYAYAIPAGRGQRLAFHPRNGLSLVCYSGKPGVVIRLDSDPKAPVTRTVLRALVAGVVVALLLVTVFPDARPEWYHRISELGAGVTGWIIAVVVLIATPVIGWPFTKKIRQRNVS